MKEHPVRLLLLLLDYPRSWVLNNGASVQNISLYAHRGIHILRNMFRVRYNRKTRIQSGKTVFLYSYICLKSAISYFFGFR